MPFQQFDFSTGKVVDSKQWQTVLYSSDDEAMTALRAVCRDKRYPFLGATDKEREVLELARKHKTGVFFLDADLEGLDIESVCATLRRMHKGFKLVVMSANATKESLAEYVRLGAGGFLLKPLKSAAIVKVFANR